MVTDGVIAVCFSSEIVQAAIGRDQAVAVALEEVGGLYRRQAHQPGGKVRVGDGGHAVTCYFAGVTEELAKFGVIRRRKQRPKVTSKSMAPFGSPV